MSWQSGSHILDGGGAEVRGGTSIAWSRIAILAADWGEREHGERGIEMQRMRERFVVAVGIAALAMVVTALPARATAPTRSELKSALLTRAQIERLVQVLASSASRQVLVQCGPPRDVGDLCGRVLYEQLAEVL